ncbi:MAG: potassium channel family protein [Bilifractor sp.]
MKNVLIIGLGRFGRHMALRMQDLGNDVLAVEINEDTANDMVGKIPNLQIADATNPQVIESLGINDFDLCVVTIEENFQAALIVTYLLHEAGAKYIIARAARDMYRKLLLHNGADYVVYTEKDEAEKLAIRFGARNVFDYNELSTNLGIYEIATPLSWVGHSILELKVRTAYGIEILAFQQQGGDVEQILNPDFLFTKDMHLFVIGTPDAIRKITKNKM